MSQQKTEVVISAVDQTKAAFASVESGLGSLQRSFGSIDGIATRLPVIGTALAGAFSVGAIVSFSKGLIDAADNINDLSQKTGIGVHALAGWQLAAESSGTSLESVAKGVKGLGKNILDHGDALRSAGISATTANDAMIQVADLFAAMPDGIEKTTLAVSLFGKAGMDMIPMLNMGSKGLAEAREKAELYASKLAELAPKADEFNDKLKEIEIYGKAAAINGLLPVVDRLNEMAGKFASATKTGAAFRAMLAEVADVLMSPGAAFVGAPVNFFKRLTAGGQQSGVVGGKPGVTGWDLAAPAVDSALDEKKAAAEKAAKAKAAKAKAADLIKSLGGGSRGASAPKEADHYTSLIRSIDEKNAHLIAEASSTEKLTGAQQFALRVMTDLQGGYLKLDDAQTRTVAKRLEEMLVNDQLNQSTEARRKALEQQARALDQYIEEEERMQGLVNSFIGNTRVMGERIEQSREMIGLRERERQIIDVVRNLENEAAAARRSAYSIKDPVLHAEAIEKINQRLAEQKVALTDAAGAAYDYATSWEAGVKTALNSYLDEASNAAAQSARLFGNAFRSMEDAIVEFTKTGKLDFKSMADSIITDLIRIQVQQKITKPLAEAMNSGGFMSGVGDFFSGIFGGGRAAGGPVDAGKFYVVGENGPELLMAGSNGTVIPNGAGGSATNITINAPIDARGADASVVPQIRQALAELEARVYRNVPSVMGRASASRMMSSAY